MSRFLCLLALLAFSQTTAADATLIFKAFGDRDEPHRIIYYIKDGALRYSEQDSKKINLYDKSGQVFLSIDQEAQTISRIDREILGKYVESLQRQRLVALAEAEKKLAEQLRSQDPAEKALAETLVNQMRYPEFYGAHTHLRTEKTTTSKTVAGIDCQVYNISRNQQILKQICIADYKPMKLASADYDTLRQFIRFDYTTQTSLMIAKGKTDFVLINYDEENIEGIPVEITEISEHENKLIFLLDEVHTDDLDAALFEVDIQNPRKMD